ncbi:MAG: hypothetical protein SangKO_054430 [Sandaracinaceae bacterium]
MSWEPVERWPGEAGGEGAFRSGAEPALASRDAPSAWERVTLFWFSTPELPLERVARRAVLTSSYVYVQRFDGRRERVRRDQLRGFRREGGRLIVGVREGEDLVLPLRAKCEVQARLLAQLGSQADAKWTGWRRVEVAVAGAVIAAAAAGVMLRPTSLADVMTHWGLGLYTSEVCLRVYVGVAACVVLLFCLLWLPMRARVDALGVEVRRGLIPWLPFFLPAEQVDGVRVVEVRGNTKHHRNVLMGYAVELVFEPAIRLASLRRASSLRLRTHRNVHMAIAPRAEAELLRRLLRIPSSS